MSNLIIRERAKSAGVKLWQIAEALGMRDFNFSRKLRHELTEEETKEILCIIDNLRDQREV